MAFAINPLMFGINLTEKKKKWLKEQIKLKKKKGRSTHKHKGKKWESRIINIMYSEFIQVSIILSASARKVY